MRACEWGDARPVVVLHEREHPLAKKVATIVACVVAIVVSVYIALPSHRPPKIDPDDYRRPWVCEACGHTFLEPPTAGVLPCPKCGKKQGVQSIVYTCGKCGAEFEAYRFKDYYGAAEATDENGQPMAPIAYFKKAGGEWTTSLADLGPIKCPKCGEITEIFKAGGGEQLAKEKNIPFLGKVPIDPKIVEASDAGEPFVYHYGKSPAAKVFEEMVEKITELEVEAPPAQAADTAEEAKENSSASVQRFAMPLADGMVSEHFGHAEKFAFVDYDVDNHVVIKQEEKTPPPHEHGVIPSWIADEKVDVLFTGGIGPAARQILEQKGVTVVAGTPSGAPQYIVSQYVKGELQASDNTCDH